MQEVIADLRKVEKNYFLGDTKIQALRGLDLKIHAGEFVVVMGRSGSGKSTLLNLLGCIDLPSAGSVSICGSAVDAASEKILSALRRQHIAFIFQAFNLIPVLSVLENIEYALYLKGIPEAERAGRALRITEEVGLHEHLHHRPNQLSGGQRQRVAIARALVTQPTLILADEPTANLDVATGRSILELMRQMNRQHATTFICATHDSDVLAYADRVISISDGVIQSDQRARGPKVRGGQDALFAAGKRVAKKARAKGKR